MQILYLLPILIISKIVKTKNIVLVHGFQSNINVWDTATIFFSKKGYNIYLFDYENTTTFDINENSNQLMEFLINKNISNSSPSFIGHSMGGIVIRQMIILFPEFIFSKIITYGTPHYGTSYIICYPFCIWEAMNQLNYNSEFIINLNSEKNLKIYNQTNLLTYSIDSDLVVDISKSFVNKGLNLIFNIDDKIFSKIKIYKKITNSFFNFLGYMNTNIERHFYLPNIPEILFNTYNFLENKFIFLKESPIIYSTCNFSSKKENIIWDIPENIPNSSYVNIISEKTTNTFISVPIYKKNITFFVENNDTFCIRFFNPETSTITNCTLTNLQFTYNNCKFKNIYNYFPIKYWINNNSANIIINNYICIISSIIIFLKNI